MEDRSISLILDHLNVTWEAPLSDAGQNQK